MRTLAFSLCNSGLAQCIGEGRLLFIAKAAEEKPAALSGPLPALANDSILCGLITQPWYQSRSESHTESPGGRVRPLMLAFHSFLDCGSGLWLGYRARGAIWLRSAVRM